MLYMWKKNKREQPFYDVCYAFNEIKENSWKLFKLRTVVRRYTNIDKLQNYIFVHIPLWNGNKILFTLIIVSRLKSSYTCKNNHFCSIYRLGFSPMMTIKFIKKRQVSLDKN